MSTRKLWVLGLCLVAAPLLGGCRTNGQTGALTGGLLGAGAGQLIGHNNGNRTAWALGAAAVGAGIGYLIGDAEDQRQAADRYYGPQTIDGTDGYAHGGDRYDGAPAPERRRVVVRRRVYHEGAPCYDDPAPCDPRW